MTDDVTKPALGDGVPSLPPFPPPVPQGGVDLWGTIQWLQRDRDAYRACMEALVELVRDMNGGNGASKDGVNWYARRDALLAACKREEGR